MNTIPTAEFQTLDVKSSAAELGVCEETIRRLIRRKGLRKLPGLRRVLIPRTEFHRYLKRGETRRDFLDCETVASRFLFDFPRAPQAAYAEAEPEN